jgi:hypothetical protein
MKGRGVAYFLPQTCADIYHTGVFQEYAFFFSFFMHSAHSP